MAQFDVYRNPDEIDRAFVPYLMDIQSHLLDNLRTRVVVPLAKQRITPAAQASRFTPGFTVSGQSVFMLTPNLYPIDTAELGRVVTNLSERRHDIIAAMDYLISGV
jgi:toxin CcdB